MVRIAALTLGALASSEALVAMPMAAGKPVVAVRSNFPKMADAELPLSKNPTKEEARREDALIRGTNWPPRTPPTPGKGYLFFQGPTPKTSVQKDMPDFFSSDNFADVEIEPIQLIVAGTGLVSLAAIVVGLKA